MKFHQTVFKKCKSCKSLQFKLIFCQNLEFQLDNLVDLKKFEKHVRVFFYVLAKIRADTAENEQLLAEMVTTFRDVSTNQLCPQSLRLLAPRAAGSRAGRPGGGAFLS